MHYQCKVCLKAFNNQYNTMSCETCNIDICRTCNLGQSNYNRDAPTYNRDNKHEWLKVIRNREGKLKQKYCPYCQLEIVEDHKLLKFLMDKHNVVKEDLIKEFKETK